MKAPLSVHPEPAYVALAGANDTLPYAPVSRRSLTEGAASEPPPSMGYFRPTKSSADLTSEEDAGPTSLAFAFHEAVSAQTNRAWPIVRKASAHADARPAEEASPSSNESVPPTTVPASARDAADSPGPAQTKGNDERLARRSGGLILLGSVLALLTANFLRHASQEPASVAQERPAASSAGSVEVRTPAERPERPRTFAPDLGVKAPRKRAKGAIR